MLKRIKPVADLNLALEQIEVQLLEVEDNLSAVEQEIASLTQLPQSAFNDTQFSIPGNTVNEQMENLVDAIEDLNHGQRQALYKNLGG